MDKDKILTKSLLIAFCLSVSYSVRFFIAMKEYYTAMIIYRKEAKPNDRFPQMDGDNDLPKRHLAYESHRL